MPNGLVDIAANLNDNSAQGILTVVSIAFGVALADLCQRAYDHSANPPNIDWWQLRIALVLLIICGSYFYYLWFVSFVTTKPDFIQVFIPFALGGTAVILARTIDSPVGFWNGTALFYAIATAGFINTYILNEINLPKDDAAKIRDLLASETIKNFGAFGVMSFAMFLIPASWKANNQGLLISANAVFLVACALSTYLCFQREAYQLLDDATSAVDSSTASCLSCCRGQTRANTTP